MIEAIIYADLAIRLSTDTEYEQYVRELLNGLEPAIKTAQIISISKPYKNEHNWTLETNVLGEFMLYIPEKESGLRVQDYVDAIVPFLKRHVPKCNDVLSTKIVQMKRLLEDHS